MQAKEENRPEQVEYEMNYKKGDGGLYGRIFCSLGPNSIECNAHQKIQQRPNGAEEIIRRAEGRFYK